MKKKLIDTILSTVVTVLAVVSISIAASSYFPDIIVTSPDGIWTDTRAYATLDDALTAVGANNRELYIIREESITTATIDDNISLKFRGDGAINNSGQLNINTKNINSDDTTRFTGAGDIDFVVGSVVRSSWFSGLYNAITLTNDDWLTLVISEQDNINANCAVGDQVTLEWESSRNRIIVNSGFTFSNIKNIIAGPYQLFAGAGDFDFLDGTELNLSWFYRLRSALTWVESEEVTIIIDKSEDLDYSVTADSNENLRIIPGNILDGVAGTETLTINGGLIANSFKQWIGSNLTLAGAPQIEKFSIRWRGAVGDGVTDDTSEIQAGVGDIEAFTNHPPLYIPTTNQFYLVSSSIDITGDNPLVIKGDNYVTSVVKAVNATPFAGGVFNFVNATHHKLMVFKDFMIHCNGDAGYGIYGEYNAGSSGQSHFKIDHMVIVGATTEGIHLEYGWNIDILESRIFSNVGGIQVANSANAVNIVNTKVYGNTGIGIYMNGGYSGRITGCTIEDNDLGGIKVKSMAGLGIDHNYFESNGNDTAGQRYAIWWGATSAYTYAGEIRSNSIVGDSVDHTGLAGIVIDYAYGGVISANDFFHLDYGYDMSSLVAVTVPIDLTIDSSNYYDPTVDTIWNPHATNEKYYANNRNRFFIPGVFDRSSGNLIDTHPIAWTRTVAGASTAAITAGEYPKFTMTKAVGDNCFLTYTLDFSKDLIHLRGKYVSFGLTVSAAVPVSIVYVTLGTTQNTITVGTSPVDKVVTVPVGAAETTMVMRIQVVTESVAFTIHDVWLTEGVNKPSQRIGRLNDTRSGAGDPTGSVVPLFIGENYFDTGSHWYKADGITNADWTALN